jgi:hypothetical protein
MLLHRVLLAYPGRYIASLLPRMQVDVCEGFEAEGAPWFTEQQDPYLESPEGLEVLILLPARSTFSSCYRSSDVFPSRLEVP